MGLTPQTVAGWEGWPDDVRDRLRAWNAAYLLSFRRTGDFVCSGCRRSIAGHPSGNAVVRSARKAHGVEICEDCLVALARTYELPPPGLDLARDSYRGALAQAERRYANLTEFVHRLEAQRGKLRRQLEIDQVYIDELERLAEPGALAALRDRLRGKRRAR